VRRDFVRVGKGWPEQEAWAVAWLRRIRVLYRCNRQRLRDPPDAAADAGLRQAVATLQEQCLTELADPSLRAPCRKVLTSLHEHWSGLTLFVADPHIPLDNNLSERRLWGPAVGRKNLLRFRGVVERSPGGHGGQRHVLNRVRDRAADDLPPGAGGTGAYVYADR
jgi:transposase